MLTFQRVQRLTWHSPKALNRTSLPRIYHASPPAHAQLGVKNLSNWSNAASLKGQVKAMFGMLAGLVELATLVLPETMICELVKNFNSISHWYRPKSCFQRLKLVFCIFVAVYKTRTDIFHAILAGALQDRCCSSTFLIIVLQSCLALEFSLPTMRGKPDISGHHHMHTLTNSMSLRIHNYNFTAALSVSLSLSLPIFAGPLDPTNLSSVRPRRSMGNKSRHAGHHRSVISSVNIADAASHKASS